MEAPKEIWIDPYTHRYFERKSHYPEMRYIRADLGSFYDTCDPSIKKRADKFIADLKSGKIRRRLPPTATDGRREIALMAFEAVYADKLGEPKIEAEPCKWEHDKALHVWITSCDRSIHALEGFKFCPFCGKVLEARR